MKDLSRLTRSERLQLLKFVAAAVWADLEVNRPEKSYLLSLALKLRIPDDEVDHLADWLERPPPPEEVDPARIPMEHRALFLEAVREAMAADHILDAPERETFRLLEDLLA
jgi:uncharacterized tellurite resistance protein B-like protein